MSNVSTQTEYDYTVVDDPNDTEIMGIIRIVKSKYTEKDIFVFYKYYKLDGNDKTTMTSYNSSNEYCMDMYIQQIKDAGDY